jgi:hypothetical protein
MLDWSDFSGAPADPFPDTQHTAQQSLQQGPDVSSGAVHAAADEGVPGGYAAVDPAETAVEDEDEFDRLSLGGLDAEVAEGDLIVNGNDNLLGLMDTPVRQADGLPGGYAPLGVPDTAAPAHGADPPATSEAPQWQQAVHQALQASKEEEQEQLQLTPSTGKQDQGVMQRTAAREEAAGFQTAQSITQSTAGGATRTDRLVSVSEQLPLHELVLQQAALAEEALLMGE